MRVMFDTNVIVSAVYNVNSTPARALHYACRHEHLVLCDHIIAECYDVVNRKFPQHIVVLDKLLNSIVYEAIIAPRDASALIADPKDAPILNAAILNEVDVIVSGDKHFLQLAMEQPKVLTAAAYLDFVQENE